MHWAVQERGWDPWRVSAVVGLRKRMFFGGMSTEQEGYKPRAKPHARRSCRWFEFVVAAQDGRVSTQTSSRVWTRKRVKKQDAHLVIRPLVWTTSAWA